jgi:hypothetical protein
MTNVTIMFSNVQFERVGNQWCGVVSPDTLADTLIDIDILNEGGVYAGSYVLQLIHGESYDSTCFVNTPVRFNRTLSNLEIFAICKAKHELITRAFTTEHQYGWHR